MSIVEDLTQAGVGGPGMWDPMPVPQPIKHEPAERSSPARPAARKRATKSSSSRITKR